MLEQWIVHGGNGAGEPASAVCYLSPLHPGPQVTGCRPGLRQYMAAVAGMHRRVPVGVKYNGWDGPGGAFEGWRRVPAPPCRMAAKAERMSRAAPQARPEYTPTAA